MTDFHFTKVTVSDLDEIIEILQDISVYKPSQSDRSKLIKNFLSQSGVFAVVAKSDTNVIGFGVLLIETKIRGGKAGHIEDIVVHERWRSRGIGQQIIQELRNLARSQGCYKMSLQCTKANVEFYNKIGFHESGITMQIII